METLVIEKTSSTPSVLLDKNSGKFELAGKSLPEDVLSFYQPVLDWIQEYLKNPNPTTVMSIQLDYFNTASSKVIFHLLKMLNTAAEGGVNITVDWRYLEIDDDSLEAGKDYASMLTVPFTFTVLY